MRRDLLVQRLAELGLHGPMLQAIIEMYWSIPLIPKPCGAHGPSINSTCRVKQGDPLSPLLFGFFIDGFDSWPREKLPDAGAKMGAKLVHMLLYAENMVLLARSPEPLQAQLLDLLQDSVRHSAVHGPSECGSNSNKCGSQVVSGFPMCLHVERNPPP